MSRGEWGETESVLTEYLLLALSPSIAQKTAEIGTTVEEEAAEELKPSTVDSSNADKYFVFSTVFLVMNFYNTNFLRILKIGIYVNTMFNTLSTCVYYDMKLLWLHFHFSRLSYALYNNCRWGKSG